MEEKSKTIVKHFEKVRDNLLAISDHLGIAKHGDLKGLAREALIQQFLKSNLAEQVSFHTGEIIDNNDEKSGQVDIIMQTFFSPRIHLFNEIKISFADNVIAAIEVKSDLKTGDIEKENNLKTTLDQFHKIKSLNRFHTVPGRERHRPHPNTPCVLFCFHGPEYETLCDKLVDYHTVYKISFDLFAPDLIVVLDKDYAIFRNYGWISPPVGTAQFLKGNIKYPCLTNMFVYLTKLMEAWNYNPKFTNFFEYF